MGIQLFNKFETLNINLEYNLMFPLTGNPVAA